MLAGQSGPGSDGKEEVLRIPQNISITGVSPTDSLVSYPGRSLGESYTSTEMKSVYSTTPAGWAKLGSNILSSESDVNIRVGKAWNAIDRLSTTWNSHLFDKIKHEFFQVVTVSMLL